MARMDIPGPIPKPMILKLCRQEALKDCFPRPSDNALHWLLLFRAKAFFTKFIIGNHTIFHQMQAFTKRVSCQQIFVCTYAEHKLWWLLFQSDAKVIRLEVFLVDGSTRILTKMTFSATWYYLYLTRKKYNIRKLASSLLLDAFVIPND